MGKSVSSPGSWIYFVHMHVGFTCPVARYLKVFSYIILILLKESRWVWIWAGHLCNMGYTVSGSFAIGGRAGGDCGRRGRRGRRNSSRAGRSNKLQLFFLLFFFLSFPLNRGPFEGGSCKDPPHCPGRHMHTVIIIFSQRTVSRAGVFKR